MQSQTTGKSKLDKTYIFRLPIYGYKVEITVSRDIVKSIRKARINASDEALAGTDAVHFPVTNESISLLFLPLNADINTIAHESTHITQRIIEWIGAGYKDKEFVAYLMAHVFQGIYEFHQKAKNFLEKDLTKE